MNRQDIRSFEEFCRNLKYHTKLETKYLLDWLDRHNGEYGRKKREYVVVPWGSYTDEIFRDDELDKIELVNRPDFLLLKTYDNSYLVKWVAPLEIQTIKPDPSKLKWIYIKKEKVERRYDSITSKVANRGQFILVVGNVENPGAEVYTLISDRELRSMANFQPIPCYVFGGKLAYFMRTSQKRWRRLYVSSEPPLHQFKMDEVI